MKPPMPSTADEIPTSELRLNPLTQEELRDIRSLIGVAKKEADHNGGASASSPQLLSGRKVMVPMTSKAFFEGVLQPPTKNASCASEEEQIIINDGGKLVEMSRTDACAYFDKQHNKVDAVKKPATTKPPPKKSVLKPSKIKSNSQSTQGSDVHVPPVDSMLPLMEIRETCDASGHILQSEIVNMSNTMKRIGDGLTSALPGTTTNDGEDEGKQLGELLAQTLKAGEGEITKDAHTTYTTETETMQEQKEDATIITGSKKAKEPISDANYEAITSRLEELERLEEEDTKSKKMNAKSSKRLQSSGWSKGFLNNTPKKKNGKATAAAAAAKKKEQKPTASTDQTPTNSTQVSFSKTTTDVPKTDSTTTAPADKSSRVSFSSSNNIKEIPRIGEMKVPPRPPPGRPVSFNPSNRSEVEVPEAVVDPFAPMSMSTVPFEENVFKGVVKERKVAVDRGMKEGVAPKKKLSRFAQQRLERGGS